MDSSNNAFLEEHKDFILKLKIKATDGTSQIRRVRLPRIADSSGLISYQELVGLCVTFTFPEGSPQNYEVSLTYFDVDKDTVTIASTHELVDAIEQFAGDKVLRITTEVKPKKGASRSPSVAAPVADSSGNHGAPLQPQIKNVLESFVGVLSTAVTHLQEGLNAPENAAASSPSAVPRPVETPVANSSARAATTAGQPEAAEDNDTAQAVSEEVTPFIHGRHTCDSCLVTPIIGKRFHATNLPDYDLCEKCHSNYKGVEVRFESVELDRDRAFQNRWQRRHQKIKKFQMKQAHIGTRGMRRRQRRIGANSAVRRMEERMKQAANASSVPPALKVPPPFAPQPPASSLQGPPPSTPAPLASCGANPFGRPHWAHIGPHPWGHTSGTNTNRLTPPGVGEFDTALKEAIRRSLKDIAPKEEEGEKTVPVKTEAQPDESSGVVEEPSQTERVVVEADILKEAPKASEKIEGDIEQGIDSLKLDEAQAMEASMETGSVDSEKLLEDDQKPAAVDRETSGGATFTKDESFESEAVGSGEIAEAVGATLDLVAGMISEMLSEADPPAKKTTTENDNNSIKEDPAEKKDNEPAGGALIVDSDESEEAEEASVSTKGEADWEVVGGDEEIARAAEMLGSALFNSEVNTSDDSAHDENVSTLSDSFSLPSSLPSISTAAQLRARWSSHLRKLNELGFQDEDQCIEVLERLQAANIGVDEEDEVSVTQVVNVLLEQN